MSVDALAPTFGTIISPRSGAPSSMKAGVPSTSAGKFNFGGFFLRSPQGVGG